MSGVRVVADSACDLPDELLAELGIGVVPLHVRFGSEELVDRVELSTKDFWARCATDPNLPETAAPSPGAFAEAFRAMADEGAEGVVCVTLSSKVSASIEAARQAARELAGSFPVRVVDSLTVTMAEGLIVLEAARAAAAGGSLEEVASATEAAVPRTKLYGTINTLENLRRGGRIGGAQALLGSLLSIKPVIEVRDGAVEQESRQRTRSRSIRYLADKASAAGPVQRLAAMGGDAPDLDELVGMLKGLPSEEGLLVGEIGPVVGAHCGPGALGVAWTA
jgi:DegV family protein with EDD domain